MVTTVTQAALVKAAPNVTARQEFGAQQTQELAETAAAAVAARERAAIEARYIMAERHPRDIEEFRLALEKECQRPSFAAVAIYRKPVGRKWNPRTKQDEEQYVEGPSIRFIETALRCYRNVYPEVVTVFDSPDVRICRVSVTDLENNLTYTTEVTISKIVERKGRQNSKGEWEPPKGRELAGEGRLNSYGEMTYPVRATDDELTIKQNAMLSKAIRTNGQRLLPGDIVEQAIRIIQQTQQKQDAKDPDAAKRQIIDAFNELGVSPSDLQLFLGHPLDRLQPAELTDLRGIYSAIKNGEATWDELMEVRQPIGTIEAAQDVAARKIEELKRQKQDAPKTDAPAIPDVQELPDRADADEPDKSEPSKPKLQFGRRG